VQARPVLFVELAGKDGFASCAGGHTGINEGEDFAGKIGGVRKAGLIAFVIAFGTGTETGVLGLERRTAYFTKHDYTP
jgi:hypothetical protein